MIQKGVRVKPPVFSQSTRFKPVVLHAAQCCQDRVAECFALGASGPSERACGRVASLVLDFFRRIPKSPALRRASRVFGETSSPFDPRLRMRSSPSRRGLEPRRLPPMLSPSTTCAPVAMAGIHGFTEHGYPNHWSGLRATLPRELCRIAQDSGSPKRRPKRM